MCQFLAILACSLFNPDPGPNSNSYRVWAALCGNVCWCVASCDSVWLVITCSMSATGLLALLNGCNIIPFPLVIHYCLPKKHMCLWICCDVGTLSCCTGTVCIKKSSCHPVPFFTCSLRYCFVDTGVLSMCLLCSVLLFCPFFVAFNDIGSP